MNTQEKLTTAKAREALEAMEQAYAYYTPAVPRQMTSEYYEYAPAA